MTGQELAAEFRKLCEGMCKTMEAKNADYARGSDPFKNLRRHGPYGIVVRLDDKISRLDSLTNPAYKDNSPRMLDESLEDTAKDTAVYALLMILLRREMNGYYSVASAEKTPGGVEANGQTKL